MKDTLLTIFAALCGLPAIWYIWSYNRKVKADIQKHVLWWNDYQLAKRMQQIQYEEAMTKQEEERLALEEEDIITRPVDVSSIPPPLRKETIEMPSKDEELWTFSPQGLWTFSPQNENKAQLVLIEDPSEDEEHE